MSPRRPARPLEGPTAKRDRSVFIRLTPSEYEQVAALAKQVGVSIPYFYEMAVWGADRTVILHLKNLPINVRLLYRVLINTRTNLDQLEPYVQGEQLERLHQARAAITQRIEDVDEILSCFTRRGLFKGWGSHVTTNGGRTPA